MNSLLSEKCKMGHKAGNFYTLKNKDQEQKNGRYLLDQGYIPPLSWEGTGLAWHLGWLTAYTEFLFKQSIYKKMKIFKFWFAHIAPWAGAGSGFILNLEFISTTVTAIFETNCVLNTLFIKHILQLHLVLIMSSICVNIVSYSIWTIEQHSK